jgi:hypothetical protein
VCFGFYRETTDTYTGMSGPADRTADILPRSLSLNRNQMIEANLKYARAAATKYTLGAPEKSPQWQDAFSAACEALVEAADAFDPSRGTVLNTIAWPRMMRAIQRLREGEKKRWALETIARHGASRDGAGGPWTEGGVGRDTPAERDEYFSGLSLSPEDLKDTEPEGRHRGQQGAALARCRPLTGAYGALAHLNGFLKYGAWNWRKSRRARLGLHRRHQAPHREVGERRGI